MVGNVVHIDEGVRRARTTRPWLTGGAELGQGEIDETRVDRDGELRMRHRKRAEGSE